MAAIVMAAAAVTYVAVRPPPPKSRMARRPKLPPPPKVAKVDRPPCDPAYARARCAEAADPFACGWAQVLDAPASLAFIDGDASDGDAALRRLFPQLAGKTIVDEPLSPPSPPPTYHFEASPPHQVTLPIDWAADPYGDRSWRSSFQNLGWLQKFTSRGGAELDAAAYVLVDWAEQALRPDAALEWTWYDAGMARRLERVAELIERYLTDHDVVNRRVLIAAARTIASHLYAMSTDACYAEHSNHGMMQDLAIVGFVRRFPALHHAEAIWQHARDRAVVHVESSVSDDGIHLENSPEYQVLYLRLVIDAIDVFRTLGEPPPPALIAARDGMQEALIYQLQPNLTLPQFGDTTNHGPPRVLETAAAARAQGGNGAILDQLDWVLSRGATGTPPADLDRVFLRGGYASLRERWDLGDPAAAITGHFKCARWTKTHYHPDDTSFEIYGYGSELVVDTGKYSYQYDDPLVQHQYDVRAHNVLVIDDAPFKPRDNPAIIAHDFGPTLSWVRGSHRNYRSLGVTAQSRTFAYARPDSFVVIDHVRAAEPHRYTQHFHLHPSLSEVTVVDDHTVIATTPGGGPSLALASFERPLRIDVVRGQKTAGDYQGWYFGGWMGAEPTAAVIFVYGERPGPALHLPVVLTVGAPGAAPKPPRGLRFTEIRDQLIIAWQRDGAVRSIRVPAPSPPL